MATTPGNFSALLVSIFLILACGCGLSNDFMNSMPGWVMCSLYWPKPVTWPKPWSRGVGLPMMLNGPSGIGRGAAVCWAATLNCSGMAAMTGASRSMFSDS